ncbi:MAG TPA: Asp-tRNA(Asn)/Glu-tRNA(Gln) amidotransferase subunit GatB [Candidatus Vogelbacteria bacterium]|nr:Asp-tRNA(Asn)/Glu-tRNA(Gln) amidotransferase subunit GatB [Candidatus Vogelbacteria bacterium]
MEKELQPTIGLEIHAELLTKSKMFCSCANISDEKEPNKNICPICLGHPGVLPVINKEAVRQILRVGLAIGGKLADFSEFDRKNYFYPDIPKGYQVSQFKYPLVSGGSLLDVPITRIHLEEDTARSQHGGKEGSLVDFNRSGLCLMELVTEPEIHSSQQAGDFARELQLLIGLEYLKSSGANMEKGEMRVEANISLNMGTKVEIKNLNSFRAMEKAIEYEIKRQTEVLEHGDRVIQETRGWDEEKQATFSQRKKEFSHDYRYFPEPDLPKLYISQIEEFKDLEKTLPELPSVKRIRLIKDYGLAEDKVDVLVRQPLIADYFEKVVAKLSQSEKIFSLAVNYIISDLLGLLKNSDNKLPSVDNFAELIKMIEAGEISSRGAKDILAELVSSADNPRKIAENKGLFQKSGGEELNKIVEEVIAENPDAVGSYKSGNEKIVQFLIGQAMKKTQGSANPKSLQEIFKKYLD